MGLFCTSHRPFTEKRSIDNVVNASNSAHLTHIYMGNIRTLYVHDEGVDLVDLRSLPQAQHLQNLFINPRCTNSCDSSSLYALFKHLSSSVRASESHLLILSNYNG